MNKKIILTVLTIVWMSIIFVFSSQESSGSTKISNSFIDNTIIKIYRFFDEDITPSQVNEITEFFFVPVRKCAHFFVYFILSILVLFTLKEYGVEKNLVYYTVLICFLYAVSDEVHQLFVVGRDGNIKDVLLDTFGSVIGIFCIRKKL